MTACCESCEAASVELAADETETFAPQPEGDEEFVLLLLDEEVPTIDGRKFVPNTVGWREPPLTLMYLTENREEGQHVGSIAAGSITRIWREDLKIWGAGKFGTDDAGQHLRQLVEDQVLNHVSSDIGGARGTVIEDEDGNMELEIEGGKIMGATVLPFSAFDDTKIVVASGQAVSLVAAAPMELPPHEWFDAPGFKHATPLTVENGRVFGHAALWGTCHTGDPNKCITPPHSVSNYAFFTTGEIETDDGCVPVGQITLGTGHAANYMKSHAAAAHYDNTGTCVADVAVGEDEFGIWVAGAMRDVDDGVARELRAARLSGDWRKIGGNLELIGLLAVNVPGFPVPRAKAVFTSDKETQLALVASGIMTEEEQVTEDNTTEVAPEAEAPVAVETPAEPVVEAPAEPVVQAEEPAAPVAEAPAQTVEDSIIEQIEEAGESVNLEELLLRLADIALPDEIE